MFIVSTGMACPVGLTAASACAAKRAGVSGFADLAVEYRGEPVVGAVVPGVAAPAGTKGRLVELLGRALADALDGLPFRPSERLPLLVGLAESGRPGGCAGLAGSVVDALADATGLRFDPRRSRAFATGHTSGFEALRAAREMIGPAGGPAGVVVACVDSLVNFRTLNWLDADFRLKTQANRDGLIPGEAAAVVLLQRDPRPGTVTEVAGLGFAVEAAHILSDEPLMGLGLAEATRQALGEAGLGLHDVDGKLSDVTGEAYGFKEVALTTARVMRTPRKQDQPLWHWCEAIGDTGAAAGVAQLVLADDAFRKGYAPGDRLIGWASAAGGGRASVVLRRRQF